MPNWRRFRSASPRSWASASSITAWSCTASRSTVPADRPNGLRVAARVAALVGILLPGLLAHGTLRLLGLRSGWVRRFLALAARACGVRTHVVGRRAPGGVLLVANHLSWLDIPVLGGATGAAFVSKAEVADWPVVGALARLAGTIFVARERRGETGAQARTLADALATGRPVVLFGEGGTGDGVTLKPFKPALLAAVAGRAGATVQPVRIDYGVETAAVAWPDGEAAGANARRLLGRAGRRHATITFLAPLDAGAIPDRKALAAQVRAAIDAAG